MTFSKNSPCDGFIYSLALWAIKGFCSGCRAWHLNIHHGLPIVSHLHSPRQLSASLLFISLLAEHCYGHSCYRILLVLEVTIVNSGKDMVRISESSDRLHATAACLYLKCWMKTVSKTKDTVLSSRRTCLPHLLLRNLTVSAPDKVLGLQGVGSRTGRCPPLH